MPIELRPPTPDELHAFHQAEGFRLAMIPCPKRPNAT